MVHEEVNLGPYFTLQVLRIGINQSKQTVQTQIRLLLKMNSYHSLKYLHLHLLDPFLHSENKLFQFQHNYSNYFRCPDFKFF